jgi:hypothetical protein
MSGGPYRIQMKGSSLKLSQRNGAVNFSSDYENDYRLPSIKDMTTNSGGGGLYSGLGILKS